MSLTAPVRRAPIEPLGETNGYAVVYERATKTYTLTDIKTGEELYVERRQIFDLCMALHDLEHDDHRRHFTEE